MTEALLQCPFCGGATRELVKSVDKWSVLCGCDAEGPWAFTEDIAIAHWNRRAATAGPAIGPSHRLDEPKSSAPDPSLPLVGDEPGNLEQIARKIISVKSRYAFAYSEAGAMKAVLDVLRTYFALSELSDPLREQIQGDEGGMASRTNSADAPACGAAGDAQRKSEGEAAAICQACNGRFASLHEGLCAICDMEDMEQMLEDRDRE